MKSKVLKVIKYILAFLPIFITVIALPFLPDNIPIHFGANFHVDRYGSKYLLVLFSAVTLIFLPCSYLMKKKASEQEKTGKNNEKITETTSMLVLIILNFINISIILLSLSNFESFEANSELISKILMGIMGVVFIILGNIMPKAKMNSVIGFRSKKTKKNEETWKRNQRFTGIAMMISGAIIVIASIVTKGFVCVIISMGVLILAGVISTIYSYKIAKKY